MATIKMTMGELRSIISEAMAAENQQVKELSLKDFESCLIRKSDVIHRKGISIYVPFVHRPIAPSGELGKFASELGTISDKKGKKTPVANSKTFLAALKRDEPIPGTNITLTAAPGARSGLVELMAASIAARYEGRGIDVVIPVASGADVSRQMAEFVANRIGAKFMDKVMAKKSKAEMVFDEPRFKRLGGTETELEMIRKMLPAYNRGVGNATIKSMKPSLKKFFSFFKPGENKESLAGKTVLVIDDNVDAGVSFDDVRDLLIEAGVSQDEMYFAAGFDYQATKAEQDFFKAA